MPAKQQVFLSYRRTDNRVRPPIGHLAAPLDDLGSPPTKGRCYEQEEVVLKPEQRAAAVKSKRPSLFALLRSMGARRRSVRKAKAVPPCSPRRRETQEQEEEKEEPATISASPMSVQEAAAVPDMEAERRQSSSLPVVSGAVVGGRSGRGVEGAGLSVLSEELATELAFFLNTRDMLSLTRTCRAMASQRDRMLAGFLRGRHCILLNKAEPFLQCPRAMLALTQFVQGSVVHCERATLTTTGNILSAYRFYDESASPITSVLASWAGLLFYSGDRPPPGLVPLPWRCIMGWITILKTSSRRAGPAGQLKIVVRGPNDNAVTYVTVVLRSPQLLHCRMIVHCESQARSVKGNWVFDRTPSLTGAAAAAILSRQQQDSGHQAGDQQQPAQ